jgi:drug/metabolite transporter (DMT)-like permease
MAESGQSFPCPVCVFTSLITCNTTFFLEQHSANRHNTTAYDETFNYLCWLHVSVLLKHVHQDSQSSNVTFSCFLYIAFFFFLQFNYYYIHCQNIEKIDCKFITTNY